MPIVQQVFKDNLGADFDLASGKIVNHGVINGTVAPTVAPLVPTKNWLFVNTVTDRITHYWDTVASAWVMIADPADDIVDVTGATLPITFPVTTIPGTPVFSPATPTSTTAIYVVTDGTSIQYAKYNGTQYISAPAPSPSPGHFRSGTGATGPDGVADNTENISRIGKTGFGVTDPSTIQATIDNFGTFTTRGTTVANSGSFYIMSGAIPNAQSALMITQTVTDCAVSVGTPLGQTAFGRYFRLHNDPTSTNNLTFQNNIIKPGRFIDLQWNGTAWASEALYQPDGFPRSGSQSVGGVIPAGATSYNDVDGSTNATVTLPTAVGRRNEVFTINHLATADATLLGTNKSPSTPLQLTSSNRVTRYISDGTNWISIDPYSVLAEFGEVALTNGSTFTTTLADLPGSTFSLPTAGTWQVTYYVHLAFNATIGNYTVGIYDGSNALIANSVACGVNALSGGAATQNTLAISVRITTTGAANYKLRAITANGTATVLNNGASIGQSGSSKVIWEKISGFAPVNTLSGNMTSMLSNALPTAVLNVGGLFEVSMPASTDVQIRALTARSVYILSEGEYPGGSFATSTAAVVNLTTAFVPADNNVHVAGERNTITIQDILTGRIFRVTAWRLAAIVGNWSGWVEEIGISTNQVISAAAPIALTNNQITYTAPYIRGFGAINIGDFSTTTVTAAESSTGITASIISGVGGSPMVMQVNLPVSMVPDTLYKVLPVITSNLGEAATANATVVCQIAGGRATTNFRVIFRETVGVAQNCNFEFVIVR